MHIRYDFKKKPDLSQFKVQCFFFLQKEDLCTFHFYLNDYTVLFDVNKVLTIDGEFAAFKINFKIAETVIENTSSSRYNFINPVTDPKLKDIHFLNEIFNGVDSFITEKSSKEEVFNFISFILTSVRKIKQMAALA